MNLGARSVIAVVLLFTFYVGGMALLRVGVYGWTVFLLLPSFLGGVVSWALRPQTAGQAARFGALAVLTGATLFLSLGVEGLICVAMALPLVLPLGALGGWFAYEAESWLAEPRSAAMLLLLPIATLTWDAKATPPVFEVRTQMVVRATPEQVWRRVVAFPDLPEPKEWFFRTGLAYPERARIDGSGPGAVRFCEFSTGAFVEPIEVWDPPHVLRFRVTENPPPLREWSPYGPIESKHLHGYLISKRGQFRLTRLPNGRTLLEGTTWYQHGLWPAEYWRWWSDAIIHRIHLRVLNHVRILAEQEHLRSW